MFSFAMKMIPLVWAILVLFLPVTATAEAELPSELAVAIKGADFTTDRNSLFIQGVEESIGRINDLFPENQPFLPSQS